MLQGCSSDWWLDVHSGAVQAAVGAVALILAIGVPLWMEWLAARRSNRENRLQSCTMAVALYPELLEAREQYTAACSRMAEIERTKDGLWWRSGEKFSDYKMAMDQDLALRIPIGPVMQECFHSFYLFGEPFGSTCSQLYSVQLSYGRCLERVIGDLKAAHPDMPFSAVKTAIGALAGHLKAMGILLSQAEMQIRSHHHEDVNDDA